MWIIVLLLVIIITFIYIDTKKPQSYPPGPRWLPVVGNYPLLRRELCHLYYHHLVWSGLAARYGPVVGLRLGRDRIVIVSGYQAIRTVLAHEEFEGRPDGFFFQLRTFGQRLGVVFTDGALWQEQRRFSLKHLRNLGLGKSAMESQIRTEAVELVASLRRKSEGGSVPIFMHDAFDICVLNSLWTMLAGERFSLEDSRLAELLEIVHESFRMLDMSGGLLNQMPFLRFLAPDRCGYRRLVHVLQRLWNFLRETVAEHRASLSLDHSRDLIDSFLQEMEQTKSQPSSTFTEEQLLSLCLDLFMAGSETTSNTLGFASLYMILYPQVQLRVQQEMDAVVGRGHQPTLHDRPRLCYVEAVLMEVQRHGNIVPVGVAHRAMKETDLMGYTIPKFYCMTGRLALEFHEGDVPDITMYVATWVLRTGPLIVRTLANSRMIMLPHTLHESATLLISLYSLHMDRNHWGDPENFRPERFITAHNKLLQDDWFIPFGFGKRRCLGESLARSSLFMFFTTLLHNFTLSLPHGQPQPSTDGFNGVTISPRPFMACLTPRK